MHGRIKVKTPKEMQAEKAREEKLLAQKFKEDVDKAWLKRKEECFDEEALILTGKILLINSDYVTMWNFRREILLYWKEHSITQKKEEISKVDNNKSAKSHDVDSIKNEIKSEPDETPMSSAEKITINSADEQVEKKDKEAEKPLDMEKIYSNELKFTSSCLIKQPKSYATWHHRQCIIQLMANPPYKEEIIACDHFLDLDERNFHCWDYRRFICAVGNINLKNELEFTQRKISQNFSNFSSFYYRSTLLTQAHHEGILNLSDIWDSEYETVSNAIFVDPNDQSPWFYHKWLLAVDQFITYQQPEPETSLHKVLWDQDNQRLIYQFHKFLHEPPFNEISIKSANQPVSISNINWEKVWPISSDVWYHSVTEMEIENLSFDYLEKTHSIDLIKFDDDSNLKFKIISDMPRGKKTNPNSKLDQEKFNNLKLLHELEPENKWINLTLAMITDGLDQKAFGKLEKIDPLRQNYYNDQKSKQILEEKLRTHQQSTKLSLSDHNLTCLYFTNHLTHLRFLDLTNNRFIKLSSSFNQLVSLQTLLMDNNKISSVDENLKLISLKTLSLKNNHLSSTCHLKPFNNCPLLKVLDITGNSIIDSEDYQLSANIKVIKD